MKVIANNKNGDTIHANISDNAIPHTIKISCNGQPFDIQTPIPTNPETGKPYFNIAHNTNPWEGEIKVGEVKQIPPKEIGV